MEPATFWDHFDALRRTLILSLLTVGIGVGLCLFFYEEIFHWIARPLENSHQVAAAGTSLQHQEIRRERLFNPGPHEAIYTFRNKGIVRDSEGVRSLGEERYAIAPGSSLEIDRILTAPDLVLFGPIEGMMTALKVSLWLGLLISSPFWATLILRFVLPALHAREKQLLILFLGGTLLALVAGISFAYSITIPFANKYLSSFNATIGHNLWSLSHYLDYTLMLMIANGLAFELGLILFFLVHCGILTADWMREKRRLMIVLAFILGALLTPPDVPTQLMLAIPLILLYEAAILYARLRIRSAHVD